MNQNKSICSTSRNFVFHQKIVYAHSKRTGQLALSLTRAHGFLSPESLVIASDSISADAVQLVIAILKKKISEVIRGSMTSKEQEIYLKGILKVRMIIKTWFVLRFKFVL